MNKHLNGKLVKLHGDVLSICTGGRLDLLKETLSGIVKLLILWGKEVLESRWEVGE
jgi:hypothetical protein